MWTQIRLGTTLFVNAALNISHLTKAYNFVVICALRVNKCEFSIIQSGFS